MATPRQVNDGVPGLDRSLIFSDISRQGQMRAAWDAYHGNLPDPLKIDSGQPNDNVKVNRFSAIVDKGVSFLFGQTVKISAEDAPEDVQEYLDGAWGDDDNRMTLLAKLAINGAVCGHAFVKIIPPNPGAGKLFPRLIILDPLNVTVITDPDDCDTVQQYIIEYATDDPLTNQATRKRQVIARVDPDSLAGEYGDQDTDDSWTITNYLLRAGQWQQQGEVIAWAHPFAPIVDCQNLPSPNELWGVPDLTPDLIEMGRSLNFTTSNISRILKFHAQPWIWARGINANQITISPGRIIVMPGDKAELNNLEMHSDLASSMNFAAQLRGDMDEQSRVPAVALGRLEALPKGNISGVALQLLFQPLIEKTVMKQRLYGRLMREASRRMLALGGYDYHTAIEIHWQNLLPVDDLSAAQTAQILSQLGVSTDTILQQLGYDPDVESDKSDRENARKMTAFSRGQGMPPPPFGGAAGPPQLPPAGGTRQQDDEQ